MLVAVVQTCDHCGIEGRSPGMHMPEGWLMFDLRGGQQPGKVGYAWNVCSLDCMQATVAAWTAGEHPMPFGMSEESQVIRDHSYDPIPDPAEADIAMLAAAAAEVAEERAVVEPLHVCVQCGRNVLANHLPDGWVQVGDDSGADELCSVNCAIAYFATALNAHQ